MRKQGSDQITRRAVRRQPTGTLRFRRMDILVRRDFRARAQQRGARARNRRQECPRQRFRDTIDREHGRIGIPSLLPHFDHDHEHRFTEHEHDKCV